jgi:hypothetical protein
MVKGRGKGQNAIIKANHRSGLNAVGINAVP